jgi:hypothetical protein
MAFKLRYTTQELQEHFRDRLSYWQGQLEIRTKWLKEERARYARYEAFVKADPRFAGMGLAGYHMQSSIGQRLGEVSVAECSIERLRLLQSHLPDLEHHDLAFEDLHKLEIKA